ncbi:hypothetical protein BDY19DRAFT_329647 [Irpex rosettiformis]|uniref:Uncharacterized protein n=1 Tax=Irpex rosettiformis TaxID=378272 RepID=A0ACB8TXS4_9APHY|nr:hypothetical protein BDY19DRAFT_329647 [Irpex rosettiformis]
MMSYPVTRLRHYPGVSDSVSLGTRISVTIGDILVLLVTWSKTAKLYREAQRLKIKAPLATLLFRDGTFYFIILLILNVLQVIEHIFPSLSTMGISQPFFETVPQIIICRFILSLRKVEPPAGNSESWASSHCHSVSLRFVGNAGESLQFDADSEEEEEFNFDEDYVHAEESNVTTSDAIEDKGRRDIDIESVSGQWDADACLVSLCRAS